MSNKKPPQNSQQPLSKRRSESNENKNILFPKKENKQLKHVLVTNGNTSLGVNLKDKNEEYYINNNHRMADGAFQKTKIFRRLLKNQRESNP